MPSQSFESTIQQILQAANEDKRAQPWLEATEDLVNGPVNETAETVSTGGSCDVLKMLFPA